MLKDTNDKFFIPAVHEFIANHKEVMPGTNIIAHLREIMRQMEEHERIMNTLKIGAETFTQKMGRWRKEQSPMPQECKDALNRLGIKISQQ